MLAALAPATLARLRFPLGELRKPAVRELARRAGLAVADKPDSQDLCFLAGTGRDAFLARHGGARRARRGDRRRRGRARRRATAAPTATRSASAAASGSAAARRCTCWRPTPTRTRSRSARARRSRRARSRCATPCCTGRASTACGCATASARSPARACAARRRLALALAEPAYGVAPGQLACLMDGEVIVGHATIAARRRHGRVHVRALAAPAPAQRRQRAPTSVISPSMTSDEIRERFLAFFAERGHLRLPSASLVPAADDTSALLDGRRHAPAEAVLPRPGAPAGAAPDELPEGVPHRRPRHRRHDRAPPHVLRDARQLLDRRLLQGARRSSSPGSSRARASASPPSGSGSPSSRATTRSASAPTRRRSRPGWRSACRASGSSPARAARTSGRPARPGRAARAPSSTSTAASSSAAADDLPGGENARFLEFWNLVFMQYDQQPPDTLTPLPARNIDTGMGLNRMAVILQDVPSVFETDQFRPLIELGRDAVGRALRQRRRPSTAACGSSPTTRAAMTFLVADGVVPSNEDRGYVLRRVMRRAIQHGRSLGFEPGLPRPLRRARARADGRRLPGAARAARARSTSGWPPRRSTSATRSSRGSACCAS